MKISKFDDLFKVVMESISEFNFLENDKTFPDGVIEVAKSDVYAYQVTSDEDMPMLNKFASRETTYDEDPEYKSKGSWICTAYVPVEAGKFWLNLNRKFIKNYNAEAPMDDDVIVDVLPGEKKELTFKHYAAKSDVTFKCFRLPTSIGEMKFNGQIFTPGSYVFINDDGHCDIYERTAIFMQQQYHVVNQNVTLSDEEKTVLETEYNEIIKSAK